MSSNFSNYFFKAYDNKPHFDEFVYGFNGTSGSQRMDGSKQAVGTIEFEASVYNRSSGLKNNGFSITGSFDNSSTFQKSLIRIDVDSTYTDGDYFASSSSEVWLRLNSTPFLIQKETLLPYLSNVINLHRVDPISSGPPVLAEVSGSFLILTQINPGSTGNECEIQNYVNSISDTTITSFSGGAAIGGGPYSINWSPSASQKIAKQTRIVNSYVLSPVRHGNFADVLYTPPSHYIFGKKQSPLVNAVFTGSIVFSSNRDIHSRIFGRYQDGEASADYQLEIDPLYTSLS